MSTTLNNILTITQYTLRESFKNRILWISLVFAVLGIAAASFIGDFTVVETRRTEAGILSSFYRFCAVFAMIILVISTMVREFNDKCLELYLSLPISRAIYFVGKLGGFYAAAAAVAGVYATAMLLFAEPGAVAFWFLSLTCELIIVVTLGFFCAMTFNQQLPAAAITALFVYLLSRIIDDIILISQSGIILHTLGAHYLGLTVKALAFVLPGLGQFTQAEWLAYNDPNIAELLPLIVGQTLIYAVLLGAAGMFDFTRKNL